jgi:hypothetical protein
MREAALAIELIVKATIAGKIERIALDYRVSADGSILDPGRMAPRLAGLRVGAFWEPGDPALISLPGPAWLGAS